MKLPKLLSLAAILALSVACSDDDESFDSSVITDHVWHLTSEKLYQPVDLNMDGTASTEMVQEFGCKTSETISFSGGNFDFFPSNLSAVGFAEVTSFECGDSWIGEQAQTGTWKTAGTNRLELTFNFFDPDQSNVRKKIYTLVGEKLINVSTEEYYTTFDVESQTWSTELVEVVREYSK